MGLHDLPRLTAEYDARGETITFNGGPCHGRTCKWPRPLPSEILIPLENLTLDNAGQVREARYTKMAARTKVGSDVVTVWLYDYVPPLSRLVRIDA